MIALTRHAVAHPTSWLLGLGVLTALLGAGLLRLELRTEGEALRPVDHPIIRQTAEDRARFEEPRRAILVVTCAAVEGCLATPAGFRAIRELDADLRRLSAVRSAHVVSLASLTRVEQGAQRLSVERFLDEIPDDPEGFRALLAAVRREPLTSGLLLDPGGGVAAIDVPLAEDRPVATLVAELEEWLVTRGAAHPDLGLRLTGPEVAEATLGSRVLRDLAVLVPVMGVVLAALLYWTIGSIAGVLIPLLEAGVVLVWTLGAMGWLGVPVTLVTTVLPVLLMAMAITDEIHLLEQLRRRRPGSDAAGSVVTALESVGRPILLTSVTTAVGFLSFLTAAMPPLRHFGLFAAFGILVAMALTFTGVPAVLVRLPSGWLPARAAGSVGTPSADRLGGLAIRRSNLGLALAAAAVLASLPGVARLRVQDSWIGNFAEDSPVASAARDFDRAFWGSYRFDVVLEGAEEGFYSSGGAAFVESLEQRTREIPQVGGSASYLTLLQSVARSMGGAGPLSTRPEGSIGDLATLTELSTQRLALRQLLTDAGDAARLRLYVKDADYEAAVELQRALDSIVAPLTTESGLSAHYSGDLPVAMEVVRAIVRNQLRSIGLTLVLVTLLLTCSFLGPRAGFAAMAPAAAAVTILLGAMGYGGMPLGIATSMFASLTVGVGVDFGIHFLYRYRAQREFGRDPQSALAATVFQVGLALRWNACVLAIGFLVLTLSDLRPNRDLGLLLAGGIVTCFAVSLLALPRLARLAVPATACLLAFAGAPGSAQADAPSIDDPCSAVTSGDAGALMERIETRTRGLRRVVHLTLYEHVRDMAQLDPIAHPRPSKPLWGIFDGDLENTSILYVFAGPGRLAGTTLLIEDQRGSLRDDRMWLYLRMFGSFNELDGSFHGVFVPGTALTYEDARAFLPADKYRFVGAHDVAEAGLRVIHACPRGDALAKELGYGRLRILVDEPNALLREIEYRDPSGRVVKRYRVTKSQRIGDHVLPVEIVVSHETHASHSLMRLEHWLPEAPPPPSLYDPSVEHERFVPRLRRYLADLHLEARLQSELDAAAREVRERDARFEAGSDAPQD